MCTRDWRRFLRAAHSWKGRRHSWTNVGMSSLCRGTYWHSAVRYNDGCENGAPQFGQFQIGDMDNADSDFNEDYGDQDTIAIDAAPALPATGNSSFCPVINYRLRAIRTDMARLWVPKASTSIWGPIFSQPSFTKLLNSVFPAGFVTTNGIRCWQHWPASRRNHGRSSWWTVIVSFIQRANPWNRGTGGRALWVMNVFTYKMCVTFVEPMICSDCMLVRSVFIHSWTLLILSRVMGSQQQMYYFTVKVSDYIYRLISSLLIFLLGLMFVRNNSIAEASVVSTFL